MSPQRTLKAIVLKSQKRKRTLISGNNGGSITSSANTPATKPPSTKSVDDWWGILEPMESGLSRIYLCENSHILGRYYECPTSSSFRVCSHFFFFACS